MPAGAAASIQVQYIALGPVLCLIFGPWRLAEEAVISIEVLFRNLIVIDPQAYPGDGGRAFFAGAS